LGSANLDLNVALGRIPDEDLDILVAEKRREKSQVYDHRPYQSYSRCWLIRAGYTSP